MNPISVEDPFSMDCLIGVGDYIPEWDVPTLGKRFTDRFSAAVDEVRSRPQPNANRKIQAVIGPTGYGKTHLFGRIGYRQSDRVHLAFINAPSGLDGSDKQILLETVLRWRLVDSLLYSSGSIAPLCSALARLLAPSFAAYFDRLEPGIQAKCAAIRNRLKEDPLTVLEVFAQVDALAPYHQLADAVRDSIQKSTPDRSADVIRALVLSASPAGDDARSWLRGEADQLPEARLGDLKLPPLSPALADILKAAAQMLGLIGVPLVICFDQLEELFKNDPAGFSSLTSLLMSWRENVPNLLMAIGCLESTWKEIEDAKGSNAAGFSSFYARVESPHQLVALSGSEAVEIVTRRMQSWDEYDPRRPAAWPFDLESVRAYAERKKPSPRYFILKECAPRFNDWLTGKRIDPIRFDGGPVEVPLVELFRLEWAKAAQSIQAEKRAAADMQDLDLWAGVAEALAIAQLGGYCVNGFRIDAQHPQPVARTPADPRPSAKISVTLNGKSGTVLVAVSKKDGGAAFGHWYAALAEAVAKDKSVVGTVVIWPRAELAVGKNTVGYRNYAEKVAAGAIRPFPLDQHDATLHQIEALRQLLLRAGNDLILNGKVISKEECRKLIVETGLLSKLKLFEFLFENWPGFETAAAPPAPPNVIPSEAPPPPVTAPQPTKLPPSPVPPVPPPSAPPTPEPTWAEAILKRAADYLKKKGQAVHPLGADVGPTFVRLKVELRGDSDFGKVKKQSENLKVHLALEHEPLIASQAGYVSIDVQRPDRQTVLLPLLLAACPARYASEPVVPAGVGVSGNVEWLNLSEPESCHLLVAGTTGSGKSEFLKAVLAALAARLEPSQVRFRLVDPKRVTFNIDPRCPYLGGPVVYDGAEALPVLEECVEEMERRYELLQRRGKDHIRQLAGADAVPRWVVVFDEFADLMTDRGTKKLLEPLLKRLGAKARAAGIHLILGTQRPEASVVTPLLRSNLPGRIGLQVASARESKLFLDEADAAYLFGKGDLVWKRGGGLIRLQSPFVPKAEFDAYLRVG